MHPAPECMDEHILIKLNITVRPIHCHVHVTLMTFEGHHELWPQETRNIAISYDAKACRYLKPFRRGSGV